MTAQVSPRVPGLLALAAVGLIGALATGHAELAVLAAPVLVFVGAGLALAPKPDVSVTLRLDRDRVLEGERVVLRASVRNHGDATVELELGLVRAGRLAIDPDGFMAVEVRAGAAAELEFGVVAMRWGAQTLGPLLVRARDRFGLVTWSGRAGEVSSLRAFPRERRLRALIAPMRTQPFIGSHVARTRGQGIEFADIRPFYPGDRVRQVNWRATARRGTLFVTERNPEHTSDIVLLIDTFEEARGPHSGSLDAAVRAAASLARGHLAQRDRVALLDFGGRVQWLEPGSGTTQLYRIIDALIASEIAFSYAWRAVESFPRRVFPPGALIVAITPLVDERSLDLLLELRNRRADVAVIEISPLAYVAEATDQHELLARRLWRLERDALHARLQSLGIAVATWDDEHVYTPELQGVNAFRRFARHALRV